MAIDTIVTNAIANDAVTAAKIPAGAVTSDIAAGSITTSMLADNAVSNAKIATGIASSKLTGALPALDGGSLTNIGDFKKVSSSTTTSAGITQYEVALPTTSDFAYLELHMLGLKSTTSSNTYWSARMREEGQSGALATSTSYRYLGAYPYSNNSGSGVSPQGDIDGNDFALMTGGFSGDGSDDFEMTTFKLQLYNTNNTTRFTRCKYMNTIEKRHNDAYHYETCGSFVVNSANKLDRIYILTNSVTTFTSYGYALYKVLV